MKRKAIILAILFMICGIFIWYSYQEQEMLHLHHTYETSLAKALKNSYKDIKEIHFEGSAYSDKPSGWHTYVRLEFKDKTEIKYRASHSLSSKTNYSASIAGKDGSKMMDDLSSRHGKTPTQVKVFYSNKTKEEIK